MLRPVVLLTACIMLLGASSFSSDKKKEPEALSSLNFTVIKDDNEKPVRNASVILHPVAKDGRQSKGGYQLKTDSEGKTASEGVPYGMVRIQVIAPGFQTYGEDYNVNQPQMDISIRLKRPQDQMTIYKKPDGSQQQGQQPPPPPK